MKKICFVFTLIFCTFLSFAQTPNPYINSYWTWVSGDNIVNVTGVYGTKGIAAPGNKPGGRTGSISWTDASGSLWLFGGAGPGGTNGDLNDLWKYNPSTNLWTWVAGDNITDVKGVYGTKGIAAAGNKPGSRDGSISWTDASGNLWLFGGFGYDASGSIGYLNDLWKYKPSADQWTWVSGDNIVNVNGVYGIKGVAATSNKPGGRSSSISWTDPSGNLWLFGGFEFDTVSNYSNDLWKYNPTSNQWTWMSGDNIVNVKGVYGTKGIAAAGNKPGGRGFSISWADAIGNLWLFGGSGYGASSGSGELNDLWKYNPSVNQWTWVSGDTIVNVTGVYGTMGIAAAGNKPGSRDGSISWTDASGNLWLFGGSGYSVTASIDLNDLWKYSPSANQWTWVKGDNFPNVNGVYGTKGLAAATNKPGSRYGSISWTDASGNLWLFGGYGYDNNSGHSYLNDLWNVYGGTINIFTGNGDWNVASNWASNLVGPKNIPASVSVIIDNITTGQCSDTGNINIQLAGKLTINPGKKLNIQNGNLTNSGMLNGTGTVSFSGGLSALSSSGAITTPLAFSNKQVYLTGNTNTRSITLTNGSNIRLDGFDLKMDTGTLVADKINYIITNGTGRLSRTVGSTPMIFPIGFSSTSYNPLTVSINRNTNSPVSTNGIVPDSFSVRVIPGVLTRSTVTPITAGAVNRTWEITKSLSGNSNLKLTGQWNTADEQPGFNRNSCFVAGVCPPPPNCAGGYDIFPSAPASGANPYTISRDSVTFSNSSDSFIVRTSPVVYTFTGAVDSVWTNPANWSGNLMPPNDIITQTITITNTMEVIIDPSSGTCRYAGTIIIQPGGKLTVQTGKILNVTGNIIVQ